MDLVKFSHTNTPYQNIGNKVRHIYNLCKMPGNEELKYFFESSKYNNFIKIQTVE